MNDENIDVFRNASAYFGYMGRWSRLVAKEFVSWLEVATGRTWLDVGTGTGVLTQVILDQAAPANIVGIDPSKDYIAFAKQQINDERVEFRLGSTGDLTLEQSEFDVAVAGLVLNFIPSAEEALESIVSAMREGGMIAAYVWDYANQMQIMRHFWSAAIKIDPLAAEFDAGKRFTLCQPDNLRALYTTGGLVDVEVIPIDIRTDFADFNDFWLPFLAAQGSISKYLMSLDKEAKAALRNQLQIQVPIHADGSIHLIVRAWAVKGIFR